MYKRFYLTPVDGRKSFYNKCYVEVVGDFATLYSYNTKIVTLNLVTKKVNYHSAFNYSMTTKRHQRAFESFYGIEL